MAPLPTNPSDLHPSIVRRLEDIENYQLPRLARCKGPQGLQRELADETKDDLEQVRRNVEVRHCYSGNPITWLSMDTRGMETGSENEKLMEVGM